MYSAPGISGLTGCPPTAIKILSAVIFSSPTSTVWASIKRA